MQIAADRAKPLGQVIVTNLVEADIEGHKLSKDEFGSFQSLC